MTDRLAGLTWFVAWLALIYGVLAVGVGVWWELLPVEERRTFQLEQVIALRSFFDRGVTYGFGVATAGFAVSWVLAGSLPWRR
jgi:hypothetical protein